MSRSPSIGSLAKDALAVRASLTPQMSHYDRFEKRRVPYLMDFNEPDLRSPVVTTDSHGFRTTLSGDGVTPVSLESFLSADGTSKGVILGASTAFGVGASGDDHSISSVLNRSGTTTWANYGGRAYNSTQESLLFALYLPDGLDHLVVFSGVNNLILAYLNAQTSPVFNSFFSQASLASAPESPSVSQAFCELVGALRNAARRRIATPKPVRDLSRQYGDILACFRRDLRVLRDLGRGGEFTVSFVFQPVAIWIAKALSQEESELFEVLDHIGPEWQIISSYLGQHEKTYRRDVENICSSLGVHWLDLNAEAAFADDTWLFVDRVHLTDQGYRLAAALLKERLSL